MTTKMCKIALLHVSFEAFILGCRVVSHFYNSGGLDRIYEEIKKEGFLRLRIILDSLTAAGPKEIAVAGH